MTKKTNKDLHEFHPLHDFVLIKPFTEKETKEIEQKKTAIALPTATEKKGRAVWGHVIGVGPGKFTDGRKEILPQGTKVQTLSYKPVMLKEGDIVIASEYDSYEIRLQGQEFLLVREEFIFTTFT